METFPSQNYKYDHLGCRFESYRLAYVCNPASTTDNLCPTLGGGIPTRTGRLRAATLSSLNCYLCRLPTLTIVEASREATVGYMSSKNK
eukprot:scaffold165383_cov25-Attheya_sp.AAC.1